MDASEFLLPTGEGRLWNKGKKKKIYAGCEIKGKKEKFCDLTPWSSLRQSKQMNKTERLGSKKFRIKSVYEEFWVFDVHIPKHHISTLWCSGESPCLSGEDPEFHSRTSRVCWVPTLRRARPLSKKKKSNVYSNTTGNEKKKDIPLRKKANFRSYTKNKALWVVGEPCTNTLPATKFPYYLPPLLHKSLKNFIRVPWQATTPISVWDALNHFESLKPFFISRRHFIDIETCHWI